MLRGREGEANRTTKDGTQAGELRARGFQRRIWDPVEMWWRTGGLDATAFGSDRQKSKIAMFDAIVWASYVAML